MLTDDAWRTTQDDGRQPIAIGRLSDSCVLKKSKLQMPLIKVSDLFDLSISKTYGSIAKI